MLDKSDSGGTVPKCGPSMVRAPRTTRGSGHAIAGRVLSILSVLCFGLFTTLLSWVVGTGGGGCWGGGFLAIGAGIVLLVPGTIIALIAIWLRPREILWMLIAGALIWGAYEVAIAVLPGSPPCTGSG